MRWLSSRSNRAREEMATTRRFSRLWAMWEFPGEEALQQREIQRHFNTRGSETPYQGGIALQLRRVTQPFPFQEGVQVRSGMAAGLVVHDPAHPLLVHEAAVDDAGLEPPVLQQ